MVWLRHLSQIFFVFDLQETSSNPIQLSVELMDDEPPLIIGLDL